MEHSDWEKLVEFNPDGIMVVDHNGFILFLNTAAANMFGGTKSGLIGQQFGSPLVPGESTEIELLSRDKRTSVAELRTMQTDWGGKPALLVSLRDITDRKRFEEALTLAKEQAETANQAKSEFLANMSHELRTPLNGIMSMMQLMESSSLDQEQKEYVQMGFTSASRLTRLLSDILDLSRIEAGQLKISKQKIDIKKLCDSVHELFMVTSLNKNVSLEYSLDQNMPAVLLGDEVRLQQILFNLVGNALKFTEEGRVNISWQLQQQDGRDIRVLITVSDTGIGMSAEMVDELFKPFVQAENAFTRRYEGAGLGLSIVSRLVQMMQGNISVVSTPGQGSTFYVSLPLELPEKTKFEQEQSAPDADDSGRFSPSPD